MSGKPVLAGDLGGTKTFLMLADCDGSGCRVRHQARFTSSDYPDLLPMVRDFLRDAGAVRPERACFGVAGPVNGGDDSQTARLTNLPWQLDSAGLARALDIPHLRLVNDFQATGYGVAGLGADDLYTLQAGIPVPHAPRAVLGAGTGLGQALLVWQGERYEVIPTEGGHADFAPADALQDALLAQLRTEFGHVSWERLLAGAGLVRIYRFLQQRSGAAVPGELATALDGGDAAPMISALGLAGRDATASAALDLFVRLYGAQAGNLALTVLARGGVYLAGGIAAKILPHLQAGGFLAAFGAKGRMSDLTAAMPVHVILNPQVGLLGAALAASRL